MMTQKQCMLMITHLIANIRHTKTSGQLTDKMLFGKTSRAQIMFFCYRHAKSSVIYKCPKIFKSSFDSTMFVVFHITIPLLSWQILLWMHWQKLQQKNYMASIPYVDETAPECRYHSVHGLSQWETTLQCNVVSHWLSRNTEWSLEWLRGQVEDDPFDMGSGKYVTNNGI